MMNVNHKMIKTLSMQNGQTLNILSLENSRGLDFASIMMMVDNCVELSEVNFGATMMNEVRINYIVKKLTPKVEKLSLRNLNYLTDGHIKTLVSRCNRITELELVETKLTNNSLTRYVHIIAFMYNN